MNNANRIVVVRIAPFAEHHGAETQGTHLDAGPTKVVKFHNAHTTVRCNVFAYAATVTSVPKGV